MRFMTRLSLCFFLLAANVLSLHLAANPLYELSAKNIAFELTDYEYLASDQRNTPIVQDVIDHSSWQSMSQQSGISLKPGGNWISFELYNQETANHMFYLVLYRNMKLKKANIYIQYPNRTPQNILQTPYQANMSSGELSIEPNTKARIFLYVETDEKLKLNLKIFSSQPFLALVKSDQFTHGFAIGGMLALTIVMLFLYSAHRNSKVLILSVYFMSKTWLLSLILGVNILWFMPYTSGLIELELPIATALSIVLLFWFTSKLFALKANHYRHFLGLKVCCWMLLIYMPLSLEISLTLNLLIIFLLVFLSNLWLIFLGVYLVKQSQRLAKVFTTLMFIQLLFNMMNIIWNNNGRDLDFYEQNLHIYCVSFWLNAFFMTFLLNREYYYQVKDRDIMQQSVIENATMSKQAQEELLALQEESQEQLEIRVQERTMELNIALQELEEANKELSEKNTRDEMTGLYNRRFYDQKILAEYRRSRRNLTPLSLVILDIDHFKQVNDTYGHLAGDECIKFIAQQLKSGLGRSTDIACRYGGEEFCLILPETDTQGAKALAETLRQNVDNMSVQYQEQEIPLKISVGVSTYQQQSEATTDNLFEAADKALYIAKENGRNQVQALCVTKVLSS